MKYQSRAFQFSIGIHVLIFMIILNVGAIFPSKKLMVIDFSLEDSPNAGTQAMNNKAENRHEKHKVIDQKPEIKNSEQSAASQPTSGITPAAVSDSQTPVYAPEVQKPEDDIKTAEVASENRIYSAKSENNENSNAHDNLDGKNRYLKENLSYIRDAVQRKINYPKIARQMGWEGRVKVSFIVCSDGHAREIKITESSGIEILDSNTIETVKKVSPFPKPPVEALVVIPIKYSLN